MQHLQPTKSCPMSDGKQMPKVVLHSVTAWFSSTEGRSQHRATFSTLWLRNMGQSCLAVASYNMAAAAVGIGPGRGRSPHGPLTEIYEQQYSRYTKEQSSCN